MHQLLRTYLVGSDRKYELYGDEDAGERVTKLLEYAYRKLNPEEKTSQWVCLGVVNIDEYIKSESNPSMMHSPDRKTNDIYSIRQLCKKLASL
ncbi:hypothetical protein [Hafnia alvei]|uniref:hypothetical protein n=1 Tax=Hafnia alvei TaxID=569 RepID=UPI000621005C|nr:hypothetical protein [Hafnia alvei]KKI42913.1 hypothetical protein XK86_15645 [Hafnia alvei]